MNPIRPAVHVCLALALAACGGMGDFSVDIPGETPGRTLALDFPPARAVEHRLPFRISGGVPPYESSIDGCPDWVTLFRDQGILAGTAPAADQGRTFFCTYVVTDSAFPDPQSTTFGLRLVVGSVERLALPSIPDQAFVIGTFRSVTLPAATGGVGPYTYSFTCVGGMLPSGVGFAPATRELAGTADAVFRDSCTYTVTDSAQPAATVSRNIEVTSAAGRSLALPPVSGQAFVIGTFRSVTLPAATGGVGPYTYSFTCAGGMLPPGVGFAPATRVLAGTADAVFRDSCTYAVTDSSQPAAMVSRNIEVTSAAARPLALPAVSDQSFVIGTFRSVTLAAATGGVEPYVYTFTCAGGMPPPGVGFAPATRVLAGTADAVFRDSCTYAVTDSSQPAATVSRNIEVTSAAGRSLALPPVSDQSFVIGTFRSVTLPAATGGVGPYTYSFTCAGGMPPPGVGFAPATRVLAGTADAVFRDSCTYAVTDSSRPAATVSRDLEVTSAAARPLALPAVSDQSFVIGTFRSVTLPAATGGVEPYVYTFTCAGGALPSGVGFTPATRVVAGTADAVFRDSCTYTVTDSSQPAATVSRNIEVTSAAGRSLALPPVSDQSFVIGTFRSVTLPAATGGVEPYVYTFTCAGGALPSGVGFTPATRVLAGTADAVFRDSCTYTVEDSSRPAATVSHDVDVIVESLDRGTWRFRTRTLDRSDHRLMLDVGNVATGEQRFVTLPHAIPESGAVGTATYALLDYRPPLGFNPVSRQLSYTHTGVDPLFDTPTTYRYQVSVENEVQDALCVDVSFHDLTPREPDGKLDTASVWIRDDAFWDQARMEYRCPDAPRREPASSLARVSNPVHTALGPVHARRAVDAARTAIRDRVRAWLPESPGTPHGFAITPSVDFASLSGLSDGFDYTGSSESLSAAVELGADAWQAGLVGSFTRTDLRYHAEAGLSGLGYHAGEHDTEILSVHPFAAWHAPSGGHLWASLGAGAGDLRHRDDLGFPSWSRSDVQPSRVRRGPLRSGGAGAVRRPRRRSGHRVLRIRDRGRRPDLRRAAHAARPRLSRRRGVERARGRRTIAVPRLAAVDRGRTRGCPGGGTGLGVRRRRPRSSPQPDGKRRRLVRPRRLRAGRLGRRRRRPLRSRG